MRCCVRMDQSREHGLECRQQHLHPSTQYFPDVAFDCGETFADRVSPLARRYRPAPANASPKRR